MNTRAELKEGDLVGFKAAPGTDCGRLFAQVRAKGKGSQDWSGIYVQLDIAQAIRYVPNQYERGEEISCIVALRVKKGHSLNVIICNDKKMAETTISSVEKANIVRDYLSTNGYTDIDKKRPLLSALGDYGVALLLIDSEDYELAIPHVLFTENVLEADTIFLLPQSKRIPCTIGSVQVSQPDFQDALRPMLNQISMNDVADASELSTVLSKGMQEAHLPSRVSWF
jgi:hypothetical protein